MFSFLLPIDDISEQIAYTNNIIENAFNFITTSTEIEFGYLQGGCQQRSHLISMILNKKFNIEHNKVWLFAPAAMLPNDSRAMFVTDSNNLTTDNTIYWNYHTAPVVKYKSNNEQFLLVFDPSIDINKPLTIDEWLSKIGNSQICKYTFLHPEKYFFNCKYNDFSELTTIIDGTFINYNNSDIDNLILEKGLAVNDVAMTIYKKYIKPIQNSTSNNEITVLNDLSNIFGNAYLLELLFIQNQSGNTTNTSYRYLISNYKDIMLEAHTLFHNRLAYWTHFTNNLI